MVMSLHADNSLRNKILSKAFQKRGCRGGIGVYLGGEVFILEPDELIERLKKFGVTISRNTLLNWEKWGLVPPASYRNSRVTEYPDHAWAEAYASWKLKNGSRQPVKNVKEARETAIKRGALFLLEAIRFNGDLEKAPALQWLIERDKVLSGAGPDDDYTYSLVAEREGLKKPVKKSAVLEKREPVKEQSTAEMLKAAQAWVDHLNK